MTDETRIESIFIEARGLPAEERGAFLDRECRDDTALRGEVLSLLWHDDAASGFMSGPAVQGVDVEGVMNEQHGLDHPERIGEFEILGLLGEGGMGVVYRAQQSNPKRIVALKVLRPGVATPSMLRRFEHEAQLLGRLQHPGIAQIYQAGTADTGGGTQPYLAMELIEGQSITEFADAHDLGMRARLELFARVCDAVQAAHVKGVIHRDLKPANILVRRPVTPGTTTSDGIGQPKILDFGVARAVDRENRPTIQTDVGQLIGTIGYMSPEQCAGDPDELDTRSDVYGLGVVAYELLSGRLPYDIGEQLVHEAVRTIREVEPAPLSSISRLYRGDVETIIGHALEKDRERRYPTAAALAADVRRYLDDEPITARPPSAAYQLRKFARRNRVLVGAACAVVLALVLGIAGTTWQMVRAQNASKEAADNATEAAEQRDAAQAAEAEARAVSEFLTDMLSLADPTAAGTYDLSMREVLDIAAEQIDDRFADQPQVELDIRDAIANAYSSLGETEASLGHLRRIRELAMLLRGAEHEDVYHVDNRINQVLVSIRAVDGETIEDVVRRTEALFGPEHSASIGAKETLATYVRYQGRLQEAVVIQEEAFEARRASLGDDHPFTLGSGRALVVTLEDAGQYTEAIELIEMLLPLHIEVLGARSPKTIGIRAHQAQLVKRTGGVAEAEALIREVVTDLIDVLGPEHPATIRRRIMHAEILEATGDPAEVLAMLEELDPLAREMLAPADHFTLRVSRLLGTQLARYGRAEEGLALLLDVADRIEKLGLGDDNIERMLLNAQLGEVLIQSSKHAESEPYLNEALRYHAAMPGASTSNRLSILNNLAVCHLKLDRPAEAEALFREVIAAEEGRAELQNTVIRTVASRFNLIRAIEAQGRLEEADAAYVEFAELIRGVYPERHWMHAGVAMSHGCVLVMQERFEEGATLLEAAIDTLAKTFGEGHRNTQKGIRFLVQAYEGLGREADAAAVRDRLVETNGDG